jgi:hypothetical protein
MLLRLCSVDADALPITDEAGLHLRDHAQHSQDHATHWPIGFNGGFQHAQTRAFSSSSLHEIENVPRVPA